jgi:hypothetical protein
LTSYERRLQRLVAELGKAQQGVDAHRGLDPDLGAIFDEISALKSSRAVHYRGGVRIEPANLPEKLLGPGYTRAELRELAIARGLEKRGYETAQIAELLPKWVERFEDIDRLRAEKTG